MFKIPILRTLRNFGNGVNGTCQVTRISREPFKIKQMNMLYSIT